MSNIIAISRLDSIQNDIRYYFLEFWNNKTSENRRQMIKEIKPLLGEILTLFFEETKLNEKESMDVFAFIFEWALYGTKRQLEYFDFFVEQENEFIDDWRSLVLNHNSSILINSSKQTLFWDIRKCMYDLRNIIHRLYTQNTLHKEIEIEIRNVFRGKNFHFISKLVYGSFYLNDEHTIDNNYDEFINKNNILGWINFVP